jgi:hypothetical protein
MRWPSILLYLALLLYGLGFAFSPTIFSGFRQLQTDPGDTVLNHYFLEHSWRCVSKSDYVGTLWSPPFFYPAKDVLGYSDNLFGAAPIYWLLRCFLPDVAAYQVWMIIGFALNFVAMAVVLRWFGIRHSLGALGAFLFAFGLPNVQQIGHQQLCHRWWTPFAIWHFWSFVKQPGARPLILCIFCVAAQFITGVYVGWFLGFGLGLLGIAVLALDRHSRRNIFQFLRSRPLSALWPAAAGCLMIAPLVAGYLRANEGYHRDFGEVLGGMPHWNSWLSVPERTLWRPILEPICLDRGGEHLLSGGLTCWILAVVGVIVLRRDRASASERLLIKSILVTVAAMIVLTFSVWTDEKHAGTLWAGVYYVVPGAKAIRMAARIYLILYPLLVVAGLIAADRLLDAASISAGRRSIIVAALTLLAAAENFYPQSGDANRSFEHALFYGKSRSVAEQLHRVDTAFGVYETNGPLYEHELMMMWAGAYANVPVVNGYSGREPTDYPMQLNRPLETRLRIWLGPHWSGTLAVVWPSSPPARRLLRFESDGSIRPID